jgi:RNA polymerase sigma factor (sigma-70 family)
VLKLAKRTRPDVEARFRACYEAYHVALHRYVSRLAGNPSLADDFTQELFVRLWKEMSTAGDPDSPRAWLYRVATNLVIDGAHKRRRTIAVILPLDSAPENRAAGGSNVEETVARRDLVRRVLQRLPEPMRQCLLLHHEGLTGKEIADVLGVKASYVGTLVLRAHDRFRRECEALGGRHGLLR